MAQLQNDPSPKTRLFLVDDEPVILRGLRLLFKGQPDVEICGEAEGEHEALEKILALQPDLALVDLTLKDGNGLALIRQLRRLCPAVKLLVFSMHHQSCYAVDAFAAGAHGYALKEGGAEQILEAIDVVMRGERYLSEEIASKAPELVPHAGLRVKKRAE
ncbi:MAG: response regulator transcription factor [Verrucomicrobia bacterium]|nr:response regulator transcription factor [Verrucomicrobiota bacterium]